MTEPAPGIGGPFFWLRHGALPVGHVEKAGNWGRIVHSIGMKHTFGPREVAFEAARKRLAPGAPSRLESAFVFPTIREARFYQSLPAHVSGKWNTTILYEVELVDPQAVFHVTDWRLTTPDGPLREDWADPYWIGILAGQNIPTQYGGVTTIDQREILTLSDIRVTGVVPPNVVV